MHKKTTILILNHAGSSIKQFAISKHIFVLIGAIFSIGLISLGFVAYDYHHLQKAQHHNRILKIELASQNDKIANQQKQILKFATEINTLKSNIIELNDFEKKIRIIANIESETDEEENNLFGVGGSPPEDLDPETLLHLHPKTIYHEMHQQILQLKSASQKQKEGFASLSTMIEKQRNLLVSTPSIRPTKGWTTSRFGYRKSPFTGRREFHRGLDIATRRGSPIIAPADGIITFAAPKGLMGNMMVIDHGYNMITRYGHIYKILKKKGTKVKRGETIALVGNTGRSTGPHLHYEVWVNGTPKNPKDYILD